MPNYLANALSPYLLQHAENPVDWHPWGEAALTRAREEEKPIFLSIGYSACHWCHVMERESFENDEVAALLNEHFIAIKVDREERPDLDQIYMTAVQMLTGHGGWPMSVFLTPDGKPFYGGTYWPPESRGGMPGFRQVLAAVLDAWRNRREAACRQAQVLTDRIGEAVAPPASVGTLNYELLKNAERKYRGLFDDTNGGFGGAPKFPHPMDLGVLLRLWRRERTDATLKMVRLTLDKMAGGGIYDHLAGGFARYSVDAHWLVPHFEKMLYDNALLSGAYLDGYLATGEERYGRIARETIDYVLEYMTDETGGLHSTEDADSEGEEGKFYVWTLAEVIEILGRERAERFCYVYDVTEAGNFETGGKNILNLPKSIKQCAVLKGWDVHELATELAQSRAALLEVRNRRVRPGKDDKVLVSWNGLMIDSIARAAAVFGEPRYLMAAERAADFILGNMRREDGRLLHTWRRGVADLDAYLDDYTCLANALISLYEASFEERWISVAVELMDTVLAHFRDEENGAFYFTADDHEQLLVRGKDFYESSVPSGNAMAATALLRLGRLCGRSDYLTAAQETLVAGADVMETSPVAAGQLLCALDMYLGPMSEIVILGDAKEEATGEAIANLRSRYLPNRVVACRPRAEAEAGAPELDPLFTGRYSQGEPPTVYVCEKFACLEPVNGRHAAIAAWKRLEQMEPRL
jgi:uncharacterized protein YyaL (SSP411 family)